ncbi:MAG: DUF481 domain-containing protein [Sulfurimicrobium sp.]|nr:DUF481 domain-containing protein [Sulfurimicrobium sp.]
MLRLFIRVSLRQDPVHNIFETGESSVPRFSITHLIATFFLWGIYSATQADTLLLVNGDQLTGTVLKKEGNAVVLRTSYAGDVTIKWADVAHIQTDKPVHVMLNDESSMKGIMLSTDAGKVRIKAGEIIETAPFDLSKLAYINPSPEVSGQGVKVTGRASVGVASVSGNSETQNLHLDGEWAARTKENRFTAGAAFNRARDSSRQTASNGRGYLKYDHFMNKKWYLYANTSAERDRFKDLNLRTTFGVGSGYQIFEGRDLNLSVEGGINYVNVDYDLKDGKGYPSARWAIKYDQLLFAGLTVFHQHEGLVSLENTEDMLLRTKTGLRFPLSRKLVGATQLNVDWDRLPPPGKASTDRTFLFNLGYQW